MRACVGEYETRSLRAAAHQLFQDKHQDMRQKRQKLTSASWLRPVCGGFHNVIRFNCAPFFASCRRHRILTVTCLDACRCAAFLRVSTGNYGTKLSLFPHTMRMSHVIFWDAFHTALSLLKYTVSSQPGVSMSLPGVLERSPEFRSHSDCSHTKTRQ
jgi:hypothetical protein